MTAQTHAPRLTPYPAVHSLTDAELCARTARAMDDDEWLGEVIACKYCGAEFPRSADVGVKRSICDECRKSRHSTSNYEKRDGGQAWYFLCVKESEFYHAGQMYVRMYVCEDIVNGIVTADHFEGASLALAKLYLSEHRISRHSWWHEDYGNAAVVPQNGPGRAQRQ